MLPTFSASKIGRGLGFLLFSISLTQVLSAPPSNQARSSNLPRLEDLAPPSLQDLSSSDRKDISQELSMGGINCGGSLRCPWLNYPPNQYLAFLLSWLKDKSGFRNFVYKESSHIACLRVFRDQNKGYCLFPSGAKVPPAGANGALIEEKVQTLINHGCFACGSVPLGGQDNPDLMGNLVLDYVNPVKCNAAKGEIVCDPDGQEKGAPASEEGPALSNADVQDTILVA